SKVDVSFVFKMPSRTALSHEHPLETLCEPVFDPNLIWMETGPGESQVGPSRPECICKQTSLQNQKTTTIQENYSAARGKGLAPKAFNSNYYPINTFYSISSHENYPTTRFSTLSYSADIPPAQYSLFTVDDITTPSSNFSPSLTSSSSPSITTASTTCSISTPLSLCPDPIFDPLSHIPATYPVPIPEPIRCFDHGCDGRTFSSIGNYRRHIREKARRSKTFPCEVCGRSFTRSTARNMHQKTSKCLDDVLFGIKF
ncbi:hypothetical protein ACMFMF_011178, partial [Clarireedia jacksonii]